MLFVIRMSHNGYLPSGSLPATGHPAQSPGEMIPTLSVCNAYACNCKSCISRYNQITKADIVSRILMIA